MDLVQLRAAEAPQEEEARALAPEGALEPGGRGARKTLGQQQPLGRARAEVVSALNSSGNSCSSIDVDSLRWVLALVMDVLMTFSCNKICMAMRRRGGAVEWGWRGWKRRRGVGIKHQGRRRMDRAGAYGLYYRIRWRIRRGEQEEERGNTEETSGVSWEGEDFRER